MSSIRGVGIGGQPNEDDSIQEVDQNWTDGDNPSDKAYDDDDESVGPSILNDRSSAAGFDEEEHGKDYDLLKARFDDLLHTYKNDIRDKNKDIRDKDKEIARSKEIIKELRDQLSGNPQHCEPWRDLLREYLLGNGIAYDHVYRESCKQENMSQTLTVFHPDFYLQNEKIDRDTLEVLLAEEHGGGGNHQPPQHPLQQGQSPFDRLPFEIQIKIFKRVFVKPGLIHCLSRLDPSNPPLDFPEADVDRRSQLPARFHFGSSPCQIILARKPNDVLAPLLVSKRWYFIGAHIFYGANTFAFNSLGEWHRFCNGIGKARVERLVNVELMWHGALMPRHPTQISRRSLGLAWFAKLRRLRTLVVHIAESVSWHTRRRYENGGKNRRILDDNGIRSNGEQELDEDGSDDDQHEEDLYDSESSDDAKSVGGLPSDKFFEPYKLMCQRTKRQPNYRGYRAMRTIQGIDYIYGLRGMDWVRFMESNGPEHRQIIRDWSFIKDVNSVVTMPKQPEFAWKSELENLTVLPRLEPGPEKWQPSEDDWRIVKAFYDDRPIVGEVPGSETSESEHGMFSDLESEDGDDEDSESDGDDYPPQNRNQNNGGSARLPVPDQINYDSDQDAAHEIDTAPNSGDEDDGDDSDDDDNSSNSANVTELVNNISSVGLSQRLSSLAIQGHGENNRTNSNQDNQSEALFVSEGSGSSRAPSHSNPVTVNSLGIVVIDLTGDSDDESSLFLRTNSRSNSVKTESDSRIIDLTEEIDEDDSEPPPPPSLRYNSSARLTSAESSHDQDQNGAASGLTTLDMNDTDNPAHDSIPNPDSDPDYVSEYEREDTPPSDYESSHTSSKRPSEDRTSPYNKGLKPKRVRHSY